MAKKTSSTAIQSTGKDKHGNGKAGSAEPVKVPGGKATLQWSQTNKTEWRAPDGDKGGARIKVLSNRWMNDPSLPDDTYYTYRDGDYLGSDNSIEGAMARAEIRGIAPDRLKHCLGRDGAPAFLTLSKEERKAAQRIWDTQRQAQAKQQKEETVAADLSKYEGMNLEQLVAAYNASVEAARELGLDRYRPMTRFPDEATALKYLANVDGSILAASAGAKAAAKQKGKAPPPAPAGRGAPAPAPAPAPEPRGGPGKARGGSSPARTAPAQPEAHPARGKRAPGGGGKAPEPAPASGKPAPASGEGEKAPGPAPGKGGKSFRDAAAFREAIGSRENTKQGKLIGLLWEHLGKELSFHKASHFIYGTDNGALENVIKGISILITASGHPYVIKRGKEKAVGLYPER